MLIKDLVEDLRIGVLALQNGLTITFLSRFECRGIILLCFRTRHVVTSDKLSVVIIVRHRDKCNRES